MKTLNDIRFMAHELGFSGMEIIRIIDEIETDGNGNVTDAYYNEFVFGLECEAENR